MKNLTYLPFLKNRYFYGKLLTADDFEQEQRYVDDKRRLINRWMFGVGIVAGLEVIRVDDYSISVEMGLALDYTGREIVVDTPVIKKLSMMDGYEDATKAEGSESVYLCIEYDQIPVEPVHNIANRGVHTAEEEEYNKYRESYHLYVTDEEPVCSDQVKLGEDRLRTIHDRAEGIQKGTYEPGIHLARIELVKAGTFYMIDRVVPLPFAQYICSQPLMTGMIGKVQEEIGLLRENFSGGEHPGKEMKEEKENILPDWQFAQGSVTVEIPPGTKQGRCLFTEEIPHGLGLGDVEILVHIVDGNYSYGGAEDIFLESEKKAEAAVRLSRKDGTFVIGIRLLENTKESGIQVGWTAIRKPSRNEIPEAWARIYINPPLVNMKTRDSVKLDAVCVNMENPQLVWSVETPRGGTIEEDGTYLAPNTPGVYEVLCRDRDAQETKAAVFIVVRE